MTYSLFGVLSCWKREYDNDALPSALEFVGVSSDEFRDLADDEEPYLGFVLRDHYRHQRINDLVLQRLCGQLVVHSFT